MQHPEPVARRLFELTEPISLVNFFSPEPNDSMAALGFRNYWDGYFAGRSAPLGRVPAEVVHAAFYNFADGEVARHIPKVWDTTTPEAAHAAREQGCVAALRRILGDLAGTPGLARAAELLARASASAPTEGRVMYAGLRALPDARGARGPALARGQHAARAPRGRPHRRPGLRADRRDARPTCSVPSPWASIRRSRSAGSTTSPGPAWPRSWTACATAACSTPPAASPRPGVRPRPGSSH